MKLNILFVHSSSELYGSDKSLLNIVRLLDRNQFQVHVILPCDGPLVDEMRKIGDVKVNIYDIAVLRRKNLSIKGGVQYLYQLRKAVNFIKGYITQNNIDIVDTNTSVVFSGAIAAKSCKIKSVWHIREIINNQFENRVISFMMNRYSDVIIANSKSTAAALCVSQKKVVVVYNAVESISGEMAQKKKSDILTVGMAGRINRWKGQQLFIDAADKVCSEFSNVRFLIAGDAYCGDEHLVNDLKAQIYSKGLSDKVKLLGQVNNMDDFYNSLDIFILPSIQPEPFGLVVIEAMEHKLPVVATNHGGPVEIVNNGKNGYLVDYRNADEMAARIVELLCDESKREAFGRNGYQKKQKVYSVPTMVRRIESIFRKLSQC